VARRILVVEDNMDLADLLVMHLHDAGYAVRKAGGGRAALKLLEDESFDLVVLDLMLPDLDGLDICRRLRGRPDYLPILMLTAKSTEFDRVLGLEVGADDYLTKPFDVVQVTASVSRALERRQSRARMVSFLEGISRVLGQNRDPEIVLEELDASPLAITDLVGRARAQGLENVQAHTAELRHYVPARMYDSVVAIGLLMFFACDDARGLLARLREAVKPGGRIALNVLVEGTTWLEPFGSQPYCLFAPDALSGEVAGWKVLVSRHDDFPAPNATLKRFHTLVAQRPVAPSSRTSSR